MNIYVGNLSPKTSAWQLRQAFEMYGRVDKISIDEKPRNDDAYRFCFVEMPFGSQASRAIRELDGKALCGDVMTVRESGVGA